MNRVTHAAGRKVFSRIVDHELSQISKNREQAYEKILDTAQKYMDEFDLGINWEYLRRVTLNQGYTLNTYINSMADQLHPNVLKTTLLNLGYEAFYNGTRTIREMRKIHNCNIPWIILMDPTSACNLHCTGCWAAEYGNKLNLTFDEMDSVITQGKELGTYFYMLTGGEPLVRKKDVIALCKKHNDCIFLAYTNGTLVDEELCRQMQEAGNLFLALSLEGKPEVNDLRRGEGVYGKVMHAMELLKENGLVFGTSICYTSQNIESVTSDEFIQMLVEKVDLKSLFAPVCAEYAIPLANARGNADIYSRAAMMQRFAEREAEGKRCILLYAGDHDPAGLRISDFLRKNLADLSGATGWTPDRLVIDRFGLNADFITKNNLTWIENLETGSGARLDNPRHPDFAKSYVQDYLAQFGARKVEANALVTRPAAGRQLCRDAIVKYVDDTEALDEWQGAIQAGQQAVAEAIARRLEGFAGGVA